MVCIVLNPIILGIPFLLKLRIPLFAEIMVEEGEEPGEVQVVAVGAVRENKFKQIFSSKIVHYMALFSIIYIGVEVTMGGKPASSILVCTTDLIRADDQAGSSRS